MTRLQPQSCSVVEQPDDLDVQLVDLRPKRLEFVALRGLPARH
jgi:hypothetical protein